MNNFYKKLILENSINFKEIQLIDENCKKIGIFLLEDAIKLSKNINMDLILLNDKIYPPICKIINYKKFIYKKNKIIKLNKKKNKTNIKEIKIGQNIDIKDYEIKINKLKKLLKENNKIKIILKFKGREIIHYNIGINLLNNIKNDLNDFSNLEYLSNKTEGKQIIMILLPKKK